MNKIAFAVGLCSIAIFAVAQKSRDGARDFNPRQVVRPVRPITEAPIAKPGELKNRIAANDLVLGVVVGKEARAYPINMLTGPQREIINDELGGRSIAATW